MPALERKRLREEGQAQARQDFLAAGQGKRNKSSKGEVRSYVCMSLSCASCAKPRAVCLSICKFKGIKNECISKTSIGKQLCNMHRAFAFSTL